jgi:hypothetical protein
LRSTSNSVDMMAGTLGKRMAFGKQAIALRVKNRV